MGQLPTLSEGKAVLVLALPAKAILEVTLDGLQVSEGQERLYVLLACRFEGYAEALETANAAMSDEQGEAPAAAVAADISDAFRLKVSHTQHASSLMQTPAQIFAQSFHGFKYRWVPVHLCHPLPCLCLENWHGEAAACMASLLQLLCV